MPKGVQRAWPSDDELRKFAGEVNGNVREGARRMGIARATLNDHLDARGLKAFWQETAAAARSGTTTTAADPAAEVSREEILEAENRELRAALAKGRQGSVTARRIEEAVKLALETVPMPPPRPAPKASRPGKDAHHVALLQLSDFHGGEDVNPEVVNGRNDYSWDIMVQRVDELVEACRSHQRYSAPLTRAVVTFGGDMCSGSNHLELAVTNEFPLAEQGVRMGYLQAEIVRRLAEIYPHVDVYAVEGNHPRLSQKPSAKDPHNNMDWVASVLAKECLTRVPNVTYTIGRATLAFEVAGRVVYLMHGDGIRSSMPGVPWGGVMRRVNSIQANYSRRIDHFLVHHFHQANVVQAGRIMMNGALKGTDEWVEKCFGGGDPPTQLLHTFDERHRRYVKTEQITPTAGIPA
jgi:transposase-like protein